MPSTFTRRTLIAGSALIAAQFALGGTALALEGDKKHLRPPSAQDEDSFLATCMKCGRCQSACPQSCIRTGVLEDGLLSWRTPIMSFKRGYCDYCGKCALVCPTGAITETDAEKNRIGLAKIDPERCLAWTAGSSCLACVDACPTSAITADASGRPVIEDALCNGCGACERNCPSNSYRSFAGGTKRGVNVEHLQA